MQQQDATIGEASECGLFLLGDFCFFNASDEMAEGEADLRVEVALEEGSFLLGDVRLVNATDGAV